MAHVRYIVDDVDVALPFYERLGFTLDQRPGPPIAIVRRGDLELWLSGPGASARRPMPDGSEPRPGGWNRLVIVVDDLDAIVASLRADGHRFRNDVVRGPGGRQILVDDPAGNPIELFEPARRA